MKKRNIFWGIFFIVATVVLIASQVGNFEAWSFWSLLGSILLVAVIIQSAMYKVWAGIFIPISVIYIIYQNALHWPYIAPWVLIIAAILVSIGFHILFKSRSIPHHVYHDHSTRISGNDDDNNPQISVSLGNTTRYLHSTALASGRLSVSLGSLEVYFGDAKLDPAGATISMDCSLGAIKLYIPRVWRVVDNIESSIGGVSFINSGIAAPDPELPALTLKGDVSMGGIEVTYV